MPHRYVVKLLVLLAFGGDARIKECNPSFIPKSGSDRAKFCGR
jgi:hypothetical protein